MRFLTARQAERLQSGAHAREQFVGGFVGERETEDLVRLRVAVDDEPRDARRHHRGLARPRAGDEHRGFQRRGDRRPLLFGRRAPAQRS